MARKSAFNKLFVEFSRLVFLSLDKAEEDDVGSDVLLKV